MLVFSILLKEKRFTLKNFIYIALCIISFIIINLITSTMLNYEIPYFTVNINLSELSLFNSIYLQYFLNHYTLNMDTAPFPSEMDYEMQNDPQGHNSNNPDPGSGSEIISSNQESNDNMSDENLFDNTNIPYYDETLTLSKGNGYKINYMKGSYLKDKNLVDIKDIPSFKTELMVNITDLIDTHYFYSSYENFFYSSEFKASLDEVKSNSTEEHKVLYDKNLIFKQDNFIRMSSTYAYPILTYMQEFIEHNKNRYDSGYTTDNNTFLGKLNGYVIGYDTRTEA